MGTRQFGMFRRSAQIAFVIGLVFGPPTFSEEISQLVEIVVDESVADVTTLRFDLDQMPSWSSYRSDDGSLMLELSNTVAGSFVHPPELVGDVVRGLEIESNPDGPITRIRILDGDTEHEIVPRGNSLEMIVRRLAPSAEVGVEATGESIVDQSGTGGPVADPISDQPETPFETPFETAAIQPSGSAERPYQADAPTRFVGTQVVAVETAIGGGEVSVYIRGDGSFAYTAFSLEGPDRFVMDLAGTVVGVEDRAIGIDEALVKKVRLGQYQEDPEPITRVVFDLWSPTVPWVESVADGVVVRFGSAPAEEVVQADLLGARDNTVLESEESDVQVAGAEVVAVVPEAAQEIAEGPAAKGLGDFDETDGHTDDTLAEYQPSYEQELVSAATVAAEAVADSVPVEEVMAENVIVEEVAAEEATAESEYQPAPQANQPVEKTVAETVPESPAGPIAAASESAYYNQQDLTVTTGEATDDPNPTTGFERQQLVGGQRQYTGEPIDLHLQDSDVRDVLRSLAQLSGLNLVIQPGVSGRVTVEFVEVPWDQALEQILKINSLGYEVEGTIMRVAPLDQFRQEAEDRQRLAQARAAAVPLTTVIERVSYAKASAVARILSARGGIMSQRGSVVVDERTNTLIIKELPAYIDTILSVIDNLDTPEPQVMIEARIIETTKRFTRTLGISWGFTGVADNEHGNTTGLVFPNNAQVDGGVSLLTGGRNGFVDLSLGNVLNTFNLDIALQAAENEGLINVLSEPRISTLNNERATIQSGVQIPIQTVSNNTVSVQYVNATLRLDVTPQVTADGTVLMDVRIQKREPLLAFAVSGSSNAPIATKEASTRVIVRDGGTTVIGGIYEVSSDDGEDRVPGLGKIKGLRNLFRNRRRNDENEELLIFITPRVIRL